MDDCCNTDNFVAAGDGEQLHDGWVHPCFDCDRNYDFGTHLEPPIFFLGQVLLTPLVGPE